jgi:hypothetical protein
MLMGRAHHIIYFASPERWQSYPEWARDRRDEIMARIKSEFREPDYEYYEGGGVAAEGDRVQSSSQPEAAVSRRAMSPESARARTVVRPVNRGSLVLVFAVLLLLGISGGMTWLVTEGAVRGETYLPTKLSSQRRVVSRVSEPAMYWVSIGIYTGIGGGSLGLALLGIWESWNLRKGRSN